jgi:hypothetical protein
MDLFQNVFFGVFELLLLRNARKRDKKRLRTFLITPVPPKGPVKKQNKKQGTKIQSRKKTTSLFFGSGLSPMRVGCGHATACGHP